MSKLGAKKSKEMGLARAVKAQGGQPAGPLTSRIVLSDVQHLGKAADEVFLAAVGADDPAYKAATENLKVFTGPGVRRVARRRQRRLTALDLGTSLETGRKLYTTGKSQKKMRDRFSRYLRQTRLLVGLLIRATGAAAPALMAERSYVMPAHKRAIAEVGTSISKPNMRSEHGTV